MFGAKDNRRADKFNKSKKHFASGKYKPRTRADMMGPRTNKSEQIDNKGRRRNKEIAEETLEILYQGKYVYENREVNISESLKKSYDNTVTYSVDETPIMDSLIPREENTKFSVVKETTLESCMNAWKNYSKERLHICALNFASAKNPGGGFLKGSNAQEESIVRSSGLYKCLEESAMYETNWDDNNNCLYSHSMIFSPNVPVFRDDLEDEFLEEPYFISFISAPAVNAKQARIRHENERTIRETMFSRMDRLLSVAVAQNVDILILGAWGCGVFGGNVRDLVEDFEDLLMGKYKNFFKEVIFAVIDDHDLKCFSDVFESD